MDDPGRPAERPRLLVLASTFPRTAGDGTPAFVADLATQQAQRFDTLVLAPRSQGVPRDERRDGFRIRRFGYFFPAWEDLADGAILANLHDRRSRLLQVVPFVVAEVLAIRRAVREFDPDIVHVHWIVPQGLAALVGARGRPWLVTTHGGDLYALRSVPWRIAKRRVLRRAGAVTAMNREMAAHVVALGTPPEQVSVMPMGVDIGRIRSAGNARRVPGRIVFVGRLVEKKGVEILLDALARLGDDLAWSLDIIGDGPLRTALETRAASLPRAVRFHGQQPADVVARTMAEAELAVFPSLVARSGDKDGLPVALLEAMAAGCAIVASQLPGIDEAVENGVHGALVPASDAAALAAALRAMLTDAPQRVRLGAAAAERARNYSVDAVGQRYVGLLADLLDDARTGGGSAVSGRVSRSAIGRRGPRSARAPLSGTR